MLISESYREQQRKLHNEGQYGLVGAMYSPLISQIVNRLGVLHLLDYGCGANTGLLKALKADHPFRYQAYDPAVDEFSSPPVPAEMVVCSDVLEHIEPDCLDDVLDDLQRLTEVVIFCSITSVAAAKVLDDGRNAHLIQEPMEWWLPKLWQRFDLQTVQAFEGKQFYVIAYAKPKVEIVQ